MTDAPTPPPPDHAPQPPLAEGEREARDWPIDRTPDDTLRWIIRNVARPAGRAKIGARPRWSVVSDLTSNGATNSARLCVWAGTDPEEIVVRRK